MEIHLFVRKEHSLGYIFTILMSLRLGRRTLSLSSLRNLVSCKVLSIQTSAKFHQIETLFT